MCRPKETICGFMRACERDPHEWRFGKLEALARSCCRSEFDCASISDGGSERQSSSVQGSFTSAALLVEVFHHAPI